jgi:hypothetical protein
LRRQLDSDFKSLTSWIKNNKGKDSDLRSLFNEYSKQMQNVAMNVAEETSFGVIYRSVYVTNLDYIHYLTTSKENMKKQNEEIANEIKNNPDLFRLPSAQHPNTQPQGIYE